MRGAGGLEDDALGRQGFDPGHELFDAGGRVGEALAGGGGSGMRVEEIFADIDADEDAVHGANSGIPRRSDADRWLSCSSW